MLCEKCQSREATVHITAIVGEHTERHDLCTDCAPINADGTPEVELSQFLSHHKIVETAFAQLAERSPYSVEAFEFVVEALHQAKALHGRARARHVSGKELLEAFRQLAIVRFGKAAKAKLTSWGVSRTEDVGNIIFRLVEANFIGKQPNDSLEEFRGGYDFAEAFPED